MSRRPRRKVMLQYPAHTSVITQPTSRITFGCCARRQCATVTFASHSCSASMSPARRGWSCRRRFIRFTISAHTRCSANAGVVAVAEECRVGAARAGDETAVLAAEVPARRIEQLRIPDGTAAATRLTHKQFEKPAASVLAVDVLFARVVGARESRPAAHARDMDSSPTLLAFKRWPVRHGTCRPISDLQPIRLFERLSEKGRPVPGDWCRSN